jgi:hypothetical protein
MPLIHQVYNSCGISSILMALKPDKNKELDSFFRKLDKKLSKALKISTDRYDFQDRVQFEATWLILLVLFKETDILDQLAPMLPDIDNFKPLLESTFDEMIIYQKTKGNTGVAKDRESLIKSGSITLNFLESYIEEQKTDAELKLLGALFGFVFDAIPEEIGGSALGYITDLDPKKPEEYMKKIEVLVNHVSHGSVLANYEYHWLALREIGTCLADFKQQEAKCESIDEITSTPHYFKFNNPLSGQVMSLTKAEILTKYHFYNFDFKLDVQKRFLEILKNRLNL